MRDAQRVVDDLTIAHLDDEFVLPCEFQHHRGDDPAEWIMYPACCTVAGSPYILGCGPCKDRKINKDTAILCDECNTVYSPASTAWRLIEPLNKAA